MVALKKISAILSMVAHACTPDYMRSGDQEDYGSRLVWEKVSKTPPQQIKAGCSSAHLVIQATRASIKRKIEGWGGPGIKQDPISKNNHCKMG
jgi:hypothetical protein